MAITFNCPCGKILAAKEYDAGQKAVCPNCGQRLLVPESPAPDEPPPVAKLASTARRLDYWMFHHQRTMVAAAALCGVLIAGGIVAYHAFGRRSSEEESEVVEGSARRIYRVELDPTADPSQWRTNFHSFARAVRTAIAAEKDLAAIFEGEPVRWDVSYQYLRQRRDLYFFEREPLLDDNTQVRVWAALLPNEIDKALALRKGEKITITGKIGVINHGRSVDRQYVIIRPVECRIQTRGPEMSAG